MTKTWCTAIDRSQLVLLVGGLSLAVISTVIFAYAVRTPFPATSPGGLLGNGLAALLVWTALIFGKRRGFSRTLAALMVFAAVHYLFLSSLFSFYNFG